MKRPQRITLPGAFASAVLGLSLFAAPSAQANSGEIVLNSSTVQVVHNSAPNTDVLNTSLDVTSVGDTGSCDGGADDFLLSGHQFQVFSQRCGFGGTSPFFAIIGYVVHSINGVPTYGTSFETDLPATLAAKIVTLPTPASACGRWKINIQVANINLSAFTTNPIALILDDAEGDGHSCFNVNALIGPGIVKPHHGVHQIRR